MAVTKEAFQTQIDAVVTAIAAGDWAAAFAAYASAEAINLGLLAGGSIDGASITRRQSLASLKPALDAARDAAVSSAPYEVVSRLI